MRLASLFSLLGTPHFHAICFILVSAAAIEALIAIWAATSRVFWFWRALAVWFGVVLLLPIRAYQPALVVAVSSPLTIVLITALRSRLATRVHPGNGEPHAGSERTHSFRYGVRDLLLATAIVGLITATLLHVLPRLGSVNLAEFAWVAAAQTVISTLAWAAVSSQRRRSWAALAAAVVAASIAVRLIRPWIAYNWSLIGSLFESGNSPYGDIQIAALAGTELALILLAALALCGGLARCGLGAKLRSLAGSAVAAAYIAWGACLGLIYWQMLWLLPLPGQFSTELTHYGRLIAVCQQAAVLEKAGFTPASEPDRQAVIAEAVALTEAANFIPYNPRTDANQKTWDEGFIRNIQLVRSLARVIDGECGAAVSRGDHDRAAMLAITNVRLGVMLQRGSTVVEFLVGVAVQGIANNRLTWLRADQSPTSARQVIAAWDRALAEQEDLDAIIYRDRAMSERAYGWASRLSNILDDAGFSSGVYANIHEADNRLTISVRLLQTELAIRLYQEEHGTPPQRLEQLVPNYLAALPEDVYLGRPLVYRPQDDVYVLYSVGHDRTDNGGRFANMGTYYSRNSFGNFVSGYDFDLETLIRP